MSNELKSNKRVEIVDEPDKAQVLKLEINALSRQLKEKERELYQTEELELQAGMDRIKIGDKTIQKKPNPLSSQIQDLKIGIEADKTRLNKLQAQYDKLLKPQTRRAA